MSSVAQGGALPSAVLPGFAGLSLGTGALPPAATAGAPNAAWGSFAGLLAQAATGPALGPEADAAPGSALWSAVSLPNGAAALASEGPVPASSTTASATTASAAINATTASLAGGVATLMDAADAWPDAWSMPAEDIGKGLTETPWSRDADLPPTAARSSALVPLKAMQGLQRLEQALMQAEALQALPPAPDELALSAALAVPPVSTDRLDDDGDASAEDPGLGLHEAAAWSQPWTTTPATPVDGAGLTPSTPSADFTDFTNATAAIATGASPVSAHVTGAPAAAEAVASAATAALAAASTATATNAGSGTAAAAGSGNAADAVAEAGPTARSTRGDPRAAATRAAATAGSAATAASRAAADAARSGPVTDGSGASGVEPDSEPGGPRRDRRLGTGFGVHTTSVLQQAAAAASTLATSAVGDDRAMAAGDRVMAAASPGAGDASTGGRDAASSQPGVTHGALPPAAARAAEGARFAQELASTFEARLSTPVQSPHFGGALGLQISTLVRHGISEARLQLHPAELGPIAVQIALDGTATQVHLAADHALTRQALEQAMPQLASALADAGFTLSGGGVSQQTASQQSAAGDGQRESSGSATPRAGAGSGASDEPVTMAPPVRRQLPGQVDLYA